MNWLFDNFQILLVLGLALAAWLKNRSEAKAEEESERRAREEMIRGLQELKNQGESATIGRQAPPPPLMEAGRWDTRPEPVPAPPPLPLEREVARPQPVTLREPDSDDIAYHQEPSPWEQFQHPHSAQLETGDAADPMESPLLQRQREMQERLARIKRETAHQVAGARETQRRVANKGQAEKQWAPLGKLSSALSDRRQVKRAVLLREILGPPLGMR